MFRLSVSVIACATVLFLSGCHQFINPADPSSSDFDGTLSLRIVDLQISPSGETFQNDASVQFAATVTFEDGSQRDVTSECDWVSDDTDVVLFTALQPGLAQPAGSGVATVSAEYNGVSSKRCDSYAMFEVDVFFVSPFGSDVTGNGSRNAPFATIPHAIDRCLALGADDVRVANGVYLTATPIDLKPGIDLKGGYDPNTWERTYPSATEVRNSSSSGGTYDIPNAAIRAIDPAITRDTDIRDFHTYGGGGDHSAGIYITNGASPTIRDNVIFGGNSTRSWGGVFVRGGSPVIRDNTIDGQGTFESYGVHNAEGATSFVRNNVIDGGAGTNRAEGINNYGLGTNPLIVNNQIFGGRGNTATDVVAGINSNASAEPRIWNNSIVSGTNDDPAGAVFGIVEDQSHSDIVNNIISVPASAAGTRGGILEETADADPARLSNNVIYGNLTVYYVDEITVDRSSISQLNDPVNTTQGGASTANLDTDPLLVQDDPASPLDLRFSAGSPSAVTQGALDLSSEADFPVNYQDEPMDLEWTVRTSLWPIGAYEKN